MSSDINIVKRIVKETIECFYRSSHEKTSFLTEEDVRLRLYRYLDRQLIGEGYRNWIHGECPWLKPYNSQKITSDLLIIDPDSIELGRFIDGFIQKHSRSKAISAIEIKLRRFNDAVTRNQFRTSVQEDVEKFQSLTNSVQNTSDIDWYVIAFDHGDESNQPIKRLVARVDSETISSENWDSWHYNDA